MRGLLIYSTFLTFCVGYKPIVLMHGIFPTSKDFEELMGYIKTAHPGTNITKITMFGTAIRSFEPLWLQTNAIRERVSQVMEEHPEGVNMLCFSQGGLICRAILQTMPKHNCHTFIALSSPLAGQYGDTDYLRYFFPGILKKELYRLFYTQFMQNEFSVANYWNDPHHQDRYLKSSNFLAVINNQTKNPHSQEYKKNFLRLKTMVAIGGPDDGVITPWQSSHFGFYDETERVVPYNQQQWFINDWFGLKTLVERNAFHTFTVPGIEHVHWPRNQTVFDKYILPWLN